MIADRWGSAIAVGVALGREICFSKSFFHGRYTDEKYHGAILVALEDIAALSLQRDSISPKYIESIAATDMAAFCSNEFCFQSGQQIS